MSQLAWEWGADSPRLRQADPAVWPVHASWQTDVQAFWGGPVGQALCLFLRQRLDSGATIYPPEPLRALALTPLNRVKVVILGQDPYHGPGQAEGLAFSVPPGQAVPPSLRNMWQERQRDLGLPVPTQGSLLAWAEQGVLLLNSTLTVEAGKANSHAGRGWEALTNAVVARCSADASPKAFLLWGAHAQRQAPQVDAGRHAVFMANHPSPLSARRGATPFLGCGHMGLANRWLQQQGRSPVAW